MKDSVALDPPVTVVGLIETPVSVGRPPGVTVIVTLAFRVLLLYVAVTVVVVVNVIDPLDCAEKLAVF